MIKSYTVSITEIDDGAEAAKQIAEKVAPLSLLKNTLGIVTAHPEFAAPGAVGVVGAAVAKALPFPTVGMTSISHCAGGSAETYMLSVLILTSDDCEFALGLSGAVPDGGTAEEAAEAARVCYGEARGKLKGEPKIAIVYAPYHHNPRHSEYNAAISKIDARLPLFGGVCNDDRQNALPRTNARVLYCGEAYEDRLAMLLISGNVSPKFYVDSVTDEAMIMPHVGVITKVCGSKLMEVNNISAPNFFKSVGFLADGAKSATHEGLLSSLFVLHTEGANITHIPIRVDDDGILCGGALAEGAGISVAFNTKESVLETARRMTAKIKAENAGGTVIIHSCLGRRYGLLGEPMAELNLINEALKGSFNYAATYATGELCPTRIVEDKAFNQDHSQTIVACVF